MKMFGLLGKLVKLAKKEPCGEEVSHRLQKVRLWLELQRGGKSSHEAARLLHVSRATLYRWARRLKEQGLEGLRPKSSTPPSPAAAAVEPPVSLGRVPLAQGAAPVGQTQNHGGASTGGHSL